MLNNQPLKLILIGDGRVGKTSIINKYINNVFNEGEEMKEINNEAVFNIVGNKYDLKEQTKNFKFNFIDDEIAKKLAQKILPTLSKDDLFKILTSYLNSDIRQFEPKLFLFYLENANYTSLKYCFEALEFHKNGVTSIELQRHLEMFYPNIPSNIIKLILKDIDEESRGIISYKDLNNYLNKVCTREENKFSENLILKHCASILDSENISTEKYLKKNLGIKSNKIKNEELLVQENEHNKYFSEVMGLSYVDCRKLWTFLSITKNNKNYNLMRLAKLVNFYRIEKN